MQITEAILKDWKDEANWVLAVNPVSGAELDLAKYARKVKSLIEHIEGTKNPEPVAQTEYPWMCLECSFTSPDNDVIIEHLKTDHRYPQYDAELGCVPTKEAAE
jgi:hypothetical protein